MPAKTVRLEKESAIDAALKNCSFANIVSANREANSLHPAFSDRSAGRWRGINFKEVERYSFALAHWLMQEGLDGRCMILAESRLEWPLAFLGVMSAGAVAIPVDAKSTPQELATFIRFTSPTLLLVSPKLLGTAREAIELAQWQGAILLLDIDNKAPDAFGGLAAAPEHFQPGQHQPDQTAVIAFTSATSGQPKAVETSAASMIHQMASLRALFPVKPGDSFLSILPLNHLFELSCGCLGAYACGGHVNYLNSILPHEIKGALKERAITHIVVVPLLMEMIRKGIERNFVTKLGDRGKALLQALQTASSLSPSNQLRRFLNRFILNELGPKLNTVMVGGATLDPGTVGFFSNMGIIACQGYGLTETSPVVTVNTPTNLKRGSVGRAMPDCHVRISSQDGEKIGEILVKGPCVMKGYLNDPALTATAIDQDQWFHTGDLGYLDEQGYLFITGRKKNLIVLDGGKKVYPEEVEKALSGSLLFQEICVTGVKLEHPSFPGKKTEQVCAVIVPQADLHAQYSPADLQTLCEQEVLRQCRELSAYKRPVRIIVQTAELPKTRTGKVKAPLVQQQLSAQLS